MTVDLSVLMSDMEIKKRRIVSATQKSEAKDTTLYKSNVYKDWKAGEPFELFYVKFIFENKESLAKIYNKAIDDALEDDVDCLILVHDDVILEEDPIPKLEKLFDDYDLVGVAGTSKIELKSPALWHLMGGGFQGGNLHGCVQHSSKEIISYIPLLYKETKPASTFGKYPHKVVMIDGVFMALNRKAIETMRFDEDCPSKFHFYDLIASLDFHLEGGRVGVGNILITHESPGLREFTGEWKAGEKYFLENYGS